DRLGRQVAAIRLGPGAHEAADMLEPALAPARLHGRHQAARDVARVAHDADGDGDVLPDLRAVQVDVDDAGLRREAGRVARDAVVEPQTDADDDVGVLDRTVQDRKSTRLNSSHVSISYAVFCLKKKKRSHKA